MKLSAFLIVVLLLAAPTWTIRELRPPDPLPATAATMEFSAARALVHVRAIARAPHPPGTPEHARVREVLLDAIRALDLEPVVQVPREVKATGPDDKPVDLYNIRATLRGTASTGTVLLVAHYDSVPEGPGAADDAAAVAAFLETLRALRAGPPLRNDVAVLLTDGEEQHLRGAKGAVEEGAAFLDDVRLVLNFEARGNSGPSILFETSDGNAEIVAGAIAAAPHLVGNSLASTVYGMMPNDTDFTVFQRAGLRGLNFAFIDGHPAYHGPLDTVENLSLASLQHHGTYALSLARWFGDRDLDPIVEATGDAVFFNLLGGYVVAYPTWLARLVGAVVTVAWFLVARRTGRRGEMTKGGGRQAVSALFDTLRLAAIAALAGLALTLLARYAFGLSAVEEPAGERQQSAFLMMACWLAGVAITARVLASSRRTHGASATVELAPWGLAPWGGATLLTSLFLPAASWLFAWPFLVSLPSAYLARSASESSARQRWVAAIHVVTTVPAALLVVPTGYLLFQTLSARPVSAFFGLVVYSGVALWLWLPHVALVDRAVGGGLSRAATIGALAFLVAGWVG